MQYLNTVIYKLFVEKSNTIYQDQYFQKGPKFSKGTKTFKNIVRELRNILLATRANFSKGFKKSGDKIFSEKIGAGLQGPKFSGLKFQRQANHYNYVATGCIYPVYA